MLRISLAPLAFGAAACGGQARVLDEGVEAAPVDMSPGAAGGAGAPSAPDISAPPGTPAQPPPEQSPPDIVDQPVAFGDPPHIDLVAGRVLELLETYCGSCHANGVAEGGFGDVLDIAELIERGLIVPGSSATSLLLARMLDGGQHPTSAQFPGPRPLTGDLTLLERYIDGLAPALPVDCNAHDFLGPDDVYALLLADVSARPAPDRPFLRYLDLTYASNAGLCGPALTRQRHALFKMINSVSTASDIAVPSAIDPGELIYRIDLRDYGWNREIDLHADGTSLFSDAWLALVAGVAGYAPELDGPDANALREQTGAAVPVLPVNAFVHAASAGDLYYALLGATGSLEETRQSLGVDLETAVNEDRVARAGFEDRRPSRESFVVRLEQTLHPERAYWYLEDIFEIRGDSIFESPLDVGQGGRQTIYHLPNGMQAYWVESADGTRLGEIPAGCLFEDCASPAGTNVAGCHGCHAEGLLPATDQIRGYAEANERIFDAETFSSVLLQYPGQSVLDALMQRDSEIHLSAAERAGVPRDTPDPISRVSLQFERAELTATAAAAELGVSTESLSENLPRLDPRLQPLGAAQGSVDRATFTDAFTGALCALRAEARNRPLGCP